MELPFLDLGFWRSENPLPRSFPERCSWRARRHDTQQPNPLFECHLTHYLLIWMFGDFQDQSAYRSVVKSIFLNFRHIFSPWLFSYVVFIYHFELLNTCCFFITSLFPEIYWEKLEILSPTTSYDKFQSLIPFQIYIIFEKIKFVIWPENLRP